MGGPLGFLVFLLVFVRAVPSYRAAYWRAVLATACRCVEGYRAPDATLVCRGRGANCREPEPLPGMALACCDDEPLFGECGEAKLIVSVSFGASALFKWKGKSCSAMVTSLSWMANVRTGFFIVRILVWNRNGLALRSVGSNNMFPPVLVTCCLPTCAQGSSVSVTGFVVNGVFLVWRGGLGFSLVPCAYGGCWLCQSTPLCVQGLGDIGVPPAGHALWAEVGGGITFVTSGGENAGQLVKLPNIFMRLEVVS